MASVFLGGFLATLLGAAALTEVAAPVAAEMAAVAAAAAAVEEVGVKVGSSAGCSSSSSGSKGSTLEEEGMGVPPADAETDEATEADDAEDAVEEPGCIALAGKGGGGGVKACWAC